MEIVHTRRSCTLAISFQTPLGIFPSYLLPGRYASKPSPLDIFKFNHRKEERARGGDSEADAALGRAFSIAIFSYFLVVAILNVTLFQGRFVPLPQNAGTSLVVKWNDNDQPGGRSFLVGHDNKPPHHASDTIDHLASMAAGNCAADTQSASASLASAPQEPLNISSEADFAHEQISGTGHELTRTSTAHPTSRATTATSSTRNPETSATMSVHPLMRNKLPTTAASQSARTEWISRVTAPGEEVTTLNLRLSPETTLTKKLPIALGQKTVNIIRRGHPAPPAADDDPWIVYASDEGGSYWLFFRPEDGMPSEPTSDSLCAVIHYDTHETTSGRFLLPVSMRGNRCGEFKMLRAALDSGTTRTALAAIGMSPGEILSFFYPAKDTAPDEKVIQLRSASGGWYKLYFSPCGGSAVGGGGGSLSLTRVELQGENDAVPLVLLSGSMDSDGSAARGAGQEQEQVEEGLYLDVRSQTGEPIPVFRAIAGVRPGLRESSEVIANWQPHTLQTGRNGELRWNSHWIWDETVLRIEAEGYKPVATSWIRKHHVPKRFYITLAEDAGIHGRVFSPEGKPATSAALALAMVHRDARLANGQLVTPKSPAKTTADSWRHPIVVHADSEGQYHAPTINDPSAAVLIVHDSGVRELSFSDFERMREIRLQPWGSVEGQVQWKKIVGSHEPVELSVHREQYGYPGVITQYETTVTDAAGRFHFPRALPGRVQIARHYPISTKDGLSYPILEGMVVHTDVKADAPTSVMLGGSGRQVKGRLVGCDPCEGTSLSLTHPAPHMGLVGDNPQWEAIGQREQSPIAGAFRYFTQAAADGSFNLQDVLPGDYQMTIGGRQSTRRVNVPPEQPGTPAETLDLGNVR